MPEPGAIRRNDETEDWERFEDIRFGRDRWVSLPANDPLRAKLDELVKSGLFDGFENDDTGEVAFHRAGGDDEDWYYFDDAIQFGENLETYGPPPADWPDYEEWPPTRLETKAEATEAGHETPQRVVNTKAVTAALEKEAKAVTAAREEEAKSFRSDQPRFWNDTETGQRYIQKANGEWELDEAGSALLAQQKAGQPQRQGSLTGLMAEAIIGGDIDRARSLRDFENEITPLEYLRLTLDYASNPDALKVLFDFVQARRPGIAGMGRQGPFGGQGQPQPSQLAGFAPGSYIAGLFDAQPESAQQQYLLGRQYRAAGGLMPGDIKTRDILPPPLAGDAQSGPFQGFTGPSNQPGGETDMDGQGYFRPSSGTAELSGGLLGASSFLRGKKERYDFEAGIPAGTPRSRESDPYKFVSDKALEMIRSSQETSGEDKAAAQAEMDRRKGVSSSALARGPGASFAGFMAGGPNLGDVTAQERAQTLAGSPYAGKVNASNPQTYAWTDWVDEVTGERFQENRATDPTKSGLSSTGFFETLQKPASKPASPFNPVGWEDYLKAAQTLGASKRPRQRSPFGPPRYIERR